MDTINNYSKMLLANEAIQRNLPKADDIELAQIRELNLYLLEFLDSVPILSSIYIYDMQGNGYSAHRYGVQSVEFNRIRQSGLLDRALSLKGSPLVTANMNHLLENRTNKNVISFTRIINSTDTMKPIGLLIVNITGNRILPSYERIGTSLMSYVEILDRSGHLLSVSGEKPPMADQVRMDLLSGGLAEEGHAMIEFGKTRYMIASTHIDKFDWTILSITPFAEIAKENDYYQLAMVILIATSLIVMMGGSFLISRTITVPIKNLVRSMRKINTGNFVPVEFKTSSYEMKVLKDGYNLMIERIDSLINQIFDEQKRLRRAELYTIQAQIKPHFLYNSFDAISSLSFAGKSDVVYKMVKSLGTYYRNSLNNGQEVITLGKEIEIVSSYIAIQNIRYRDLIELEIDVDQRYIGLPLLKLILQPLVENALYHGIMPKGERGKIAVSATEEGDWLVIKVADDGIGMSEERIRAVMKEQTEDLPDRGFGLKSTIQRIQLFYDLPDLVSITSEVGKGTEIRIRIPIAEGRQRNGGYGHPTFDR